MTAPPKYTFIIPTYRRPDMIGECLASLCALDYPLDRIEVLVIDNGGENATIAEARPYLDRLSLRYLVNRQNRGYGYSVNRGIVEAAGDRMVLLNDDARPDPSMLLECDKVMDADPTIGCMGARAIEAGYQVLGTDIGRIDQNGGISGNFVIDCGEPIDVDHLYGFCYVFTRASVERSGVNDRTLLARPYSSGDRIETDHCLNVRRAGLRVVYNPRMVARHLAKPRPDMSEDIAGLVAQHHPQHAVSVPQALRPVRPRCARRCVSPSCGTSASCRRLRSHRVENIGYFLSGLRARSSAYWHYLLYLLGTTSDSPDAVRRLVAQWEADAPGDVR